MPTITRPKRATDPYQIRVRVKKDDKRLLLECALIDPAEGLYKQKALFRKVEILLTLHFNVLRKLADQPSPAHLVAALKPIASESAKLATLLNPSNMPVKLQAIFDTDLLGKAWFILREIEVLAAVNISRLEQQESRGEQKRAYSDALNAAKDHLTAVLREFAPDATKEDREEYLKICLKYLPKQAARKIK